LAKRPSHQDARNAITQALGESIIAWSNLEHNLTLLFAFMVGPRAANIKILTCVNSLEVRLSIINAAVEARCLDSASMHIWQKIFNEIRKKAKHRNQLAHSTLFEESFGCCLVPFYKMDNNLSPKIRTRDIYERIGSFNQLAESVRWFADLVAAGGKVDARGLPPKPDLVLRILAQDIQTDTENP
jgi:hypothetical protein